MRSKGQDIAESESRNQERAQARLPDLELISMESLIVWLRGFQGLINRARSGISQDGKVDLPRSFVLKTFNTSGEMSCRVVT